MVAVVVIMMIEAATIGIKSCFSEADGYLNDLADVLIQLNLV